MPDIILRPDLRTAGGEVSDILVNGLYAGTLTLVYRENDRIAGALQLEKESLSARDKQDVDLFVQQYIQTLAGAVGAPQCDLLATCSPFDYMLQEDGEGRLVAAIPGERLADPGGVENRDNTNLVDTVDREGDEPGTGSPGTHRDRAEDACPPVRMNTRPADASGYELRLANQNEYEWNNSRGERLAEAFVRVYGPDVVATVNWDFFPDDDDLDRLADRLVKEFDENQIDSFVIHMKAGTETVETIELTHEDLLEEVQERASSELPQPSKYRIELVRDDVDTLTYDIYCPVSGGLPIGTATVDISQNQLTGFMDFREKTGTADMESIAMLLLRELEKEKQYDSMNLTVLYQNKPVEEMKFYSGRLH